MFLSLLRDYDCSCAVYLTFFSLTFLYVLWLHKELHANKYGNVWNVLKIVLNLTEIKADDVEMYFTVLTSQSVAFTEGALEVLSPRSGKH